MGHQQTITQEEIVRFGFEIGISKEHPRPSKYLRRDTIGHRYQPWREIRGWMFGVLKGGKPYDRRPVREPLGTEQEARNETKK